MPSFDCSVGTAQTRPYSARCLFRRLQASVRNRAGGAPRLRFLRTPRCRPFAIGANPEGSATTTRIVADDPTVARTHDPTCRAGPKSIRPDTALPPHHQVADSGSN